MVFRDAVRPQISMEILASGLHGIFQEEVRVKGREAQGVWRDEFERGNVFLFAEEAVVFDGGRYARLGILQMPYFPHNASYLGATLQAAYRASDAPPPVVRVVANLLVEETHYTVFYSVPAHMFLSADTPLREVEIVRNRLQADGARIFPRLKQAMVTWLATCQLTGFAKAQTPYKLPAGTGREPR